MRTTHKHILYALAYGSIAAISYYLHFIRPDQIVQPIEKVFVLGYIILLFSALTYILVRYRVQALLADLSRYRQITFIIGSLLAGIIITLAIPLSIPPPPPTPTIARVVITATGNRNQASQGSELWLEALLVDNVAVPLQAIHGDQQWIMKDGQLVSAIQQPATLFWEGLVVTDVQLQLLAHPWSGIATIQWQGQEQSIDLYTSQYETRVIRLALPMIVDKWSLLPWRFLANLIDSITLGNIILFAILLLRYWSLARHFQRLLGISQRVFLAQAQLLRTKKANSPVVKLGILLIPGLLLIPVAHQIDIARPLSPWSYLVSAIYNLILVSCLFAAVIPSSQILRYLIRYPLPTPLIFRRRYLGQTIGAWILACLFAGIAALILWGRLSASYQQAYWVHITANTLTAPPATLRYNSGHDAAIPFSWQPSAPTVIALRSIQATDPIVVQTIVTDRGIISLDRVKVSQATINSISSTEITLNTPDGALLQWPASSHAVTVTLAPGSGDVELLWNNMISSVKRRATPVQLSITSSGLWEGWALLPSTEIKNIIIEIPTKAAVDLSRIELIGSETQVLASGPQQCNSSQTTKRICSVAIQFSQAVNPNNYAFGLVALLIIPVILFSLWLILFFARRLRSINLYFVPTKAIIQSGIYRKRLFEPWQTPVVMWGVWAITFVFHLFYALTLPQTYTTDSTDYYKLGQELFRDGSLAALKTVRVPGYPFFIGAMNLLFGDNVLAIAMVQHVAISLLAPLTIWALMPRMDRIWAILAGFLVGVSPALSVTANILWSETLFTVLTIAAFLFYIRLSYQPRSAILVGLCLGAATMIRSNGLLLLAVLIICVLLTAWCRADSISRQRLLASYIIFLLGGYFIIAGPWHLVLAMQDQSLDLTRGHTTFTSWAAAVYQRRIGSELAANMPHRAIWAVPSAWNSEPFSLLADYPEVLKGTGITPHSYYAIVQAEAARQNPDRLRENIIVALTYNLLNWKTEKQDFIYWIEVKERLKAMEMSAQTPPVAHPQTLIQLLDALVYRWQPANSPARSLIARISYIAIDCRFWISLISLLCVPFLIFVPALRILIVGWLYWLGLVVSTALIGMPAERYMVVVEPLLYIFVVASLYSFISILLRKKPVVPYTTTPK